MNIQSFFPPTNTFTIDLFWVLVAVLAGVILIFNRVRSQDIKILRESNQDLRDAIEDKGNQIDKLKDEVVKLQAEVGSLSDSATHFEDLIVTALNQYFQSNPGVVVDLQMKLNKKVKRTA